MRVRKLFIVKFTIVDYYSKKKHSAFNCVDKPSQHRLFIITDKRR